MATLMLTCYSSNMLHDIRSILSKPNCRALVAGAKADPIFPLEAPDVFIGAHAGIFHANQFDASTLRIGIITNWFLCKEASYCDTVRKVIQNVQLDHLIIIESIRQEYENILPSELVFVQASAITRLSASSCTLLELRYLGFGYFSSLLATLSLSKLAGFVLQLFTEKTSYLTRLSTGMFGVLYIYNLLPKGSTLFISGIGLQLGGGYFFDSTNNMQKAGHYSQDIYIADKLVRNSPRVSKSVVFTDQQAQQALLELSKTSIAPFIYRYLSSISKSQI